MTPDQRAEWCQQVAIKTIEDAIGDKYELRSTESVGPKIGEELMHGGILAALATMAAIVVYVWFRYEWQFGVGALIAMLHDIISTLGIFVIFQLDFSLTALAAVLTIAGYSINDKVVIFDRVRENLRRYKKMGLIELLNFSINEALARTLMTASTVSSPCWRWSCSPAPCFTASPSPCCGAWSSVPIPRSGSPVRGWST